MLRIIKVLNGYEEMSTKSQTNEVVDDEQDVDKGMMMKSANLTRRY